MKSRQRFGMRPTRVRILDDRTFWILCILLCQFRLNHFFLLLQLLIHFKNHHSIIQAMMFSPKNLYQTVRLLLLAALLLHQSTAFTNNGDVPMVTSTTGTPKTSVKLDQLRKEWIDRSVNYYSKVMREERRRNMGQIREEEFASEEYQEEFLSLAKQHYFALTKIRDGQHRKAEIIYRRIIDQIMSEEEDGQCDHAKLAVTTLLLALHCQRMGDLKKSRSVFLNFFRVVVVDSDDEDLECACSAKVLGAYALFEMKQGNVNKSLEIARKAVQFDQAMEPVLSWKQFREAQERKSQ